MVAADVPQGTDPAMTSWRVSGAASPSRAESTATAKRRRRSVWRVWEDVAAASLVLSPSHIAPAVFDSSATSARYEERDPDKRPHGQKATATHLRVYCPAHKCNI